MGFGREALDDDAAGHWQGRLDDSESPPTSAETCGPAANWTDGKQRQLLLNVCSSDPSESERAAPATDACPCYSDLGRGDIIRGPQHVCGYRAELYEEYAQETMSYQEWATQRRPFTLPPGLPRPPRSPQPPSPTAEGLDDEWDAWYDRNVANGVFSDWLSTETQAVASGSSSSGSSSSPGEAQHVADEGTGCCCGAAGVAVASGFCDDDLDSECDDWFARNVASGNFASWLEEERAALLRFEETGDISAPESPTPSVAAPLMGSTSAPAADSVASAETDPVPSPCGLEPAAVASPEGVQDPGSSPAAAAAPSSRSLSPRGAASEFAVPGAVADARTLGPELPARPLADDAACQLHLNLPLLLVSPFQGSAIATTTSIDQSPNGTAMVVTATDAALSSGRPPISPTFSPAKLLGGLKLQSSLGTPSSPRHQHQDGSGSPSDGDSIINVCEEDSSAPTSPVSSDCHTGYGESLRDSSRSCSALSLQSWGEAHGGSGSDDDGEDAVVALAADDDGEQADMRKVKSDAGQGFEGFQGTLLCAAGSFSSPPLTSYGAFCGSGAEAPLASTGSEPPLVLPSVDCASWEAEVECRAAAAVAAHVVKGEGAVAGTSSAGAAHAVAWGLQGEHGRPPHHPPCWGGGGCVGEHDVVMCPPWLEPHLHCMLGAVVADALFEKPEDHC